MDLFTAPPVHQQNNIQQDGDSIWQTSTWRSMTQSSPIPITLCGWEQHNSPTTQVNLQQWCLPLCGLITTSIRTTSQSLMTAHTQPIAHKEFGSHKKINSSPKQLNTGYAFAKQNSMSPSATWQLTPTYKIGGPSTMKQQILQPKKGPQGKTTYKIGCTQESKTHPHYHHYRTLPGRSYHNFARRSSNSAYLQTSQTNRTYLTADKHSNSWTTNEQYSNNTKNIFTTREEHHKNKMHTTKSNRTSDLFNNGLEDNEHFGSGTSAHNWMKLCDYKTQVASINSSGNLGSTYKAKPTQDTTLSALKKQHSLWTSWQRTLRTTSKLTATLTTSTRHCVGIRPSTRWKGSHPRTPQNERQQRWHRYHHSRLHALVRTDISTSNSTHYHTTLEHWTTYLGQINTWSDWRAALQKQRVSAGPFQLQMYTAHQCHLTSPSQSGRWQNTTPCRTKTVTTKWAVWIPQIPIHNWTNYAGPKHCRTTTGLPHGLPPTPPVGGYSESIPSSTTRTGMEAICKIGFSSTSSSATTWTPRFSPICHSNKSRQRQNLHQ